MDGLCNTYNRTSDNNNNNWSIGFCSGNISNWIVALGYGGYSIIFCES